ncbi:MAG: hypothetical protein Q9213_003781 [Squamulea squamosa]
MFAAIKRQMLFLSPRNNLEGHLTVLQDVDCQIFLKAKNTSIDHILRKKAMRAEVIPELEEFLDDIPVATYPYFKSFKEAQMDPCLVLHTAMLTGLPRPITWRVGIFSTYEAWRTTPAMNGYVPTPEIYQPGRRAYTSMPLFHTSSLNAAITALLLGVTLVYGAPQIVPSASYTDDMHKFANVDGSMGAPSLASEGFHGTAQDGRAAVACHNQANIHAPAHGKLDQNHVMSADSQKPISNLGQSNIQRSRTYATYATEVSAVFRFADDPSEQYNLSHLPRMNFFDEKNITNWLVRMVAEITRIEAMDMDQDHF